jgi:hypothetical protein
VISKLFSTALQTSLVWKKESSILNSHAGGDVSLGNLNTISSYMKMNDDFVVLAQFLESLGPEVSGHASSTLTEEQSLLLNKFAEGRLTDEERDALLPEILGNEKALHELVKNLQSQA